ncbi:MAG: DUF4177 domain-containing protein [Nitrososphaerota archaeon]|jgi:hypothetical protein|nr:DUF4177 domain-containing protein [Candidatus Termitimicrobium sp.]MCL2432485.1 DUF4177 domain-containing protein [Candidatus Termitimicrobium sp.]MDR0493122.1 DUF4177 domain-containing protein [Nitrososphaerota archaeon]
MRKYEYKCVRIFGFGGRRTRILNEHANDGWEFIQAWGVFHYFKRGVN